MSRLQIGTENGAAIELHYEDFGSGLPVVLISRPMALQERVKPPNLGFHDTARICHNAPLTVRRFL